MGLKAGFYQTAGTGLIVHAFASLQSNPARVHVLHHALWVPWEKLPHRHCQPVGGAAQNQQWCSSTSSCTLEFKGTDLWFATQESFLIADEQWVFYWLLIFIVSRISTCYFFSCFVFFINFWSLCKIWILICLFPDFIFIKCQLGFCMCFTLCFCDRMLLYKSSSQLLLVKKHNIVSPSLLFYFLNI